MAPQLTGNKALVAARTLLVDEPRRKLLAAAGLAGNVDRGLGARELPDHVARLLDRRTRPEQFVLARRGLAGLVRQRQGRLDQRAQLFERQRLGQVVERAGLERRHGIFGAAERGDDRHRQVGALRADIAHQLQSVAVGQPHVGEAQVILTRLQPILGRGHRADGLDREPHADERKLQQLADVGLVVDDQHGALGRGCRAPVCYAACHWILKSAPGPRSR